MTEAAFPVKRLHDRNQFGSTGMASVSVRAAAGKSGNTDMKNETMPFRRSGMQICAYPA